MYFIDFCSEKKYKQPLFWKIQNTFLQMLKHSLLFKEIAAAVVGFPMFDIKNQLTKGFFFCFLTGMTKPLLRTGWVFLFMCPQQSSTFVTKLQNIDLLPNYQKHFGNCDWVSKLISLKGRYKICRSLFVKPIFYSFFKFLEITCHYFKLMRKFLIWEMWNWIWPQWTWFHIQCI